MRFAVDNVGVLSRDQWILVRNNSPTTIEIHWIQTPPLKGGRTWTWVDSFMHFVRNRTSAAECCIHYGCTLHRFVHAIIDIWSRLCTCKWLKWTIHHRNGLARRNSLSILSESFLSKEISWAKSGTNDSIAEILTATQITQRVLEVWHTRVLKLAPNDANMCGRVYARSTSEARTGAALSAPGSQWLPMDGASANREN